MNIFLLLFLVSLYGVVKLSIGVYKQLSQKSDWNVFYGGEMFSIIGLIIWAWLLTMASLAYWGSLEPSGLVRGETVEPFANPEN